MAYGGFVSCSCLRRGLVEVPEELAPLVHWNDRLGARGPDYQRAEERARWDAWAAAPPCGHPRLEAARMPLGNNLGVGVFIDLLERMARAAPDPRLDALIEAMPGYHGDSCSREVAERALSALPVLEERAPGLTVSGLHDGRRLVWWSAGSRMWVVLAGFSGPRLCAVVEEGVLTLDFEDGARRISGRSLHVAWHTESEPLARITNPITGHAVQMPWPYRDIPSPRGFTGPLPMSTIATQTEAVRVLAHAAVAHDMPIFWG